MRAWDRTRLSVRLAPAAWVKSIGLATATGSRRRDQGAARRVAAEPSAWRASSARRELLAALNHPNIAVIYGLERIDGVDALVLELVEGPTLAERMRRGPLAVDEALAIARQIADALEAAHEPASSIAI